jgi:hypothetical protein
MNPSFRMLFHVDEVLMWRDIYTIQTENSFLIPSVDAPDMWTNHVQHTSKPVSVFGHVSRS